jgi:GT2 family glycosyltransferase
MTAATASVLNALSAFAVMFTPSRGSTVLDSMAATPSPRVSVVIPSWNGRAWLDVVLPSLEAQRFRDFETIVVDNGSSDGSVGHVRERYPWAQIVALERNLGFAAAVNRGIRATTGEYVALVNNDIELHEDFLGALVAGLDSHPGAASATAKMLDLRARDVIDGAGDMLRWSGVVRPRGRGERDAGQYDAPAEVFSACAGAALYRRSALAEVGPFDEAFFAQMEDVDWGFRARLLGHGCRYVPEAVAWHAGSASMRPDPWFWGLAVRNCVWMWVKCYPAGAIARRAHLLLGHELAGFAFALREGMAGARLRATAAALRGLPRVLRQRRAIQAARRIGRPELERVIEPEVVSWRRLGRLARHGRPAPGER